jgi:hypothetical protein
LPISFPGPADDLDWKEDLPNVQADLIVVIKHVSAIWLLSGLTTSCAAIAP